MDAFGGVDRHDASADLRSGGCSALDLETQCPGGDSPYVCQPTWTDVLAHPPCSGTPANGSSVTVAATWSDCGAYRLLRVWGLEWSWNYYYDIASGMLAAIFSDGNDLCSGPAQGIHADCSAATATPLCTLYGGGLSYGDAGLVSDGGQSACLGDHPLDQPLTWNAPCGRDGGVDAGPSCYASCSVFNYNSYKYVGCVSGSSVGTMCYASCADCP